MSALNVRSLTCASKCKKCGEINSVLHESDQLSKYYKAEVLATDRCDLLASYPVMFSAQYDFERNALLLKSEIDIGDLLRGGVSYAAGAMLSWRTVVEPALADGTLAEKIDAALMKLRAAAEKQLPELLYPELGPLKYIDITEKAHR